MLVQGIQQCGYNPLVLRKGYTMKQILIMLTALLLCLTAQAQKADCPSVAANNDFLGIQTIRLWPGDAPEAKGTTCDDIPALSILAPHPGYENGSAVVVLPGGSYSGLAANLEGRQVADWFTAHGFRAFVLRYRLSSHGYLLPITYNYDGSPAAERIIQPRQYALSTKLKF